MRVSVTLWLSSTVLAAALACGSTADGQPPHPAPPPAATTPTAIPVAPDRRIGALFVGGGTLHTCSGSVLDSATGNLMLTAAHCLAGGVDAVFVPGFDDDSDGRDGWHVDTVYLDPRWVQGQDPKADFAIARVSRDDGVGLQAAAGGGLRLGSTPAPGSDVTVTGYGAGTGGGPTSCHVLTAGSQQGFPEVHCDGVVGGFSGGPWVTGSTVSGIVGGLDGGGCEDAVSYSPPFDGGVAALLSRAEAGGPGDDAPSAFDDGCE